MKHALAVALVALSVSAPSEESKKVTPPVCSTRPDWYSLPVPGAVPSYLRINADQMIGGDTVLGGLSFLIASNQHYALECRLLVRSSDGVDDVATGLYAYLDSDARASRPAFVDLAYTDRQYGSTGGFINLSGIIEGGPDRTLLVIRVQSVFGPSVPVMVRKGSWCRYSAY